MNLSKMKAVDQDFNIIHFFKKTWKNIIYIIICSIFFSFGNVFLLSFASTIPSGVSAISQMLSYVFSVLERYITLIYLALNIPLLIFFYFLIKKKFILLTTIFLVFNALFGILWGSEAVTEFLGKVIVIYIPKIDNTATTLSLMEYKKEIVSAGWPILIYVLIAAITTAPSAAFLWKNGASTGGSDIVAHYFSTKAKKSVGFILIIIGFSITIISLIVLWSLKNYSSLNENIVGFDHIFGLQTIMSFLYITICSFLINTLYPKYKKILLKIDGRDLIKIQNWLEESKYWHPYKIYKGISGYDKKEIQKIETVVLVLEAEEIIKKMKQIDPNIWISTSKVHNVYGRFNYKSVE